MNKLSGFILLATLILFSGSGCSKNMNTASDSVSAPASRPIEIPAHLQSEALLSITNGKTLYEAYVSGKGLIKDDPFLDRTRDLIEDFCNLEYWGLIVEQNGERNVYFIGQPPTPNNIVFGRHYKVTGNTIFQSTKTCAVTTPRPKNAAAAFFTHIFSPVPSEFYVFLSLLHKELIYVGTSFGAWRVDGDQIVLLKINEGNFN